MEKTNAELKDQVALLKLDSDLLINMIDSLGHPQDDDGNDVLTQHVNLGSVFDTSKWTDGYYSIDSGSSATYAVKTDGTVENGNNWYYDGAYKFKVSGFATKTTENLDGSVVEYVSSATGSADGTITWSETKKTDTNGNISYNGATIESGLSSLISYTFYSDHRVKSVFKSDGTTWESINCYPLSATLWTLNNSSNNATIDLQSRNIPVIKFTIPSGTADQNFGSSTFEVMRIESSGQMRLKTGLTIIYDL